MENMEATIFLLLLFIIVKFINEPLNVVEVNVNGKWKDRASQF